MMNFVIKDSSLYHFLKIWIQCVNSLLKGTKNSIKLSSRLFYNRIVFFFHYCVLQKIIFLSIVAYVRLAFTLYDTEFYKFFEFTSINTHLLVMYEYCQRSLKLREIE